MNQRKLFSKDTINVPEYSRDEAIGEQGFERPQSASSALHAKITIALKEVRRVNHPKKLHRIKKENISVGTKAYFNQFASEPLVLHEPEEMFIDVSKSRHDTNRMRKIEEETELFRLGVGQCVQKSIAPALIAEICQNHEQSLTKKIFEKKKLNSAYSSENIDNFSSIDVVRSLKRLESDTSKSQPMSRSPTILSRSSTLVRLDSIRRKEEIIEAEKQQILNSIENKRNQAAMRLVANEKAERCKIFMTAIFASIIARDLFVPMLIRKQTAAEYLKSIRLKYSILKIRMWYRHQKLRKIMLRNIRAVQIVRLFACILTRRFRVKERNKYCDLIKAFVTDTIIINKKTQRIYRYRRVILKIQRWVRSHLECTEARVKLLGLALNREIVKVKVQRHKEIHKAENISINKLKKNDLFGETVSKLDQKLRDIHVMMSITKDKTASHRVLDTSSMFINMGLNMSLATQPGNKSKVVTRACTSVIPFYSTIRRILHHQRRRYCLAAAKPATNYYNKSFNNNVDENEVKKFLKTTDYKGNLELQIAEKNFVQVAPVVKETFLMLTGGGLKEIEAVAFQLAIAQENIYHNPKSLAQINMGNASSTIANKRLLRTGMTSSIEIDNHSFGGSLDDESSESS